MIRRNEELTLEQLLGQGCLRLWLMGWELSKKIKQVMRDLGAKHSSQCVKRVSIFNIFMQQHKVSSIPGAK